jgi:REP element-mobilizing transposase RayT
MNSEELKFFNPFDHVEKTLNRLPHWKQAGASYFITFRLADAVPMVLRREWERERSFWMMSHPKPWDENTEKEYHLHFSLRMDKWLDAGHGACHLRQPECREVVRVSLEGEDIVEACHLHAWVIMPNHVHVLMTLRDNATLSMLLQSWKGGSSHGVNRLLDRRGTLWQKDYFDRLIRDGDHFANCVRYIRANPKKAHLREGEFTHYESELARLFAERR